MITKFLNLEWKQFFRSSFFGKGIAIKILMAFVALYFITTFLALGVGGYYILKKEFPEKNPLHLVNGMLLFVLILDVIIRYFMQKIPVMNIKPLLTLPIKKDKLTNYVLIK